VIQKARPNRSSIDPVIEAPQIPAPIMRPKSIPSVTPRRSAP
jgi:hypothetical protein